MDLKINAIHFDADKKLEDYIGERVQKLQHFDEDLSSAEINLSLEKPVGKNFDSKIVKIKVKSKGVEYFAEKKSESFESSTSEAVQAIEVQIKKRKEKKLKKK